MGLLCATKCGWLVIQHQVTGAMSISSPAGTTHAATHSAAEPEPWCVSSSGLMTEKEEGVNPHLSLQGDLSQEERNILANNLSPQNSALRATTEACSSPQAHSPWPSRGPRHLRPVKEPQQPQP